MEDQQPNKPQIEPIVLRDADEIQYAHDLFTIIVNDGLIDQFSPSQQIRIGAATDVLCWVLKHGHNPTFQEVLDCLKEQGLVLKPLTPEEYQEQRKFANMMGNFTEGK